MSPLSTLQSLEPIFFEAGKLALKMQAGVKHHDKYNTGNAEVDIVTEADLAVQEFLLQEMVKTDLVECRLLAEENTPLAQKFNEQGKYYIGIDPIDGTAEYAQGGKSFSTIISLHDGKNIFYTFGYYPALDWSYKVINNVYSASGEVQGDILPSGLEKTIFYWQGNPEQNIPKDIYEQVQSQGFIFKKTADMDTYIDRIMLLANDKIAGVYFENPDVYDGISELSISLAKGFVVYSGGAEGKFVLSNIQKRAGGLYYPGYYLTIMTIRK